MKSLKLRYTAASRRGSRNGNQDNLRIGDDGAFMDLSEDYAASGTLSSKSTQVFCVCDGVGGAYKGDMASMSALMGVREYLAEPQDESLEDLALNAAQAAQEKVVELYERLAMVGGTTLVMAAVRGDQFVLLNIGDSPAFLYRRSEDTLEELSQRHNEAWAKRRRGETPEPGDSSRLWNYLGDSSRTVWEMAHVRTGTLAPGDGLLLCSDGVSEAFSEEQLKKMLKWRIGADTMAKKAAKQRDSDNCTAICIRMKKER